MAAPVTSALALHSGKPPAQTGLKRFVRSSLSSPLNAVLTAVINKRAGGMGLISGRKAFQRPMKEGAELLQRIQDVYLDKNVTVA